MKKYSYIIVMETGKVVYWTGYAEDSNHGEGLAIDYAINRHGGQVFDIASRPVED